MPGKDPGGAIGTILLGIAGVVIGCFIGRALFGYGRAVDNGNVTDPGFLVSLVLAVVGAIVLLAVYRLIKVRAAVENIIHGFTTGLWLKEIRNSTGFVGAPSGRQNGMGSLVTAVRPCAGEVLRNDDHPNRRAWSNIRKPTSAKRSCSFSR